ncbi:PLDc N-terminal domain-containing protein [Belliella kenyensis]|uniref:PLDc N-terminal domain-containing protein n=1 Tax=Belliella kenyensis TaxID=1472724 RepID=A0ABV8EK99_9BACT|nr:PLDc N-terminal domain-containing protein [Belliella kenyensis]MCH7403712.1 PLDc N-terminal domain-containing protein [Belliella kenyensis]MDN3603479.1 PLDc N-terminal domain-containing protein [Belliella kenyensis]
MDLLMIGGLNSFLLIFGMMIGIAYLVFWIITLVNATQSSFIEENMKLIWILIILFANPVGAVIYWVVAPGQKKKYFKPLNK